MNEPYPHSCATLPTDAPNATEHPDITVAEDQLINSLLAVAIGRDPVEEDFRRVGLSYSSQNPKLRTISVDDKCLGSLVYEKEELIGGDGTKSRISVKFDPDIKMTKL